MNAGITLQTLIDEVTRQNTAKKDWIAPLGRIQMVHGSREGLTQVAPAHEMYAVMSNGHDVPMAIRPVAHGHLSEEAGIPKPFYDRLRTDHATLLTQTLNTLLHEKKNSEKRKMVRTLDGNLRALLSDRYRPLDNYGLLEAVLPTLEEHRVEVVSSQITESRMFIKVVLPNLQADIQGVTLGQGHHSLKSNIVVAALTITNSEVGSGSLQVIPCVFDTFCTNLAQLSVRFMRKYHIGRVGVGDGDSVEELLTTDTRVQRDKAFFMTVRDIVKSSLSDRGFHEAIAEIKAAQADQIESRDLPQVVEIASEILGIGKETRPTLLTNLVQRGDLSRWGLTSAVTALANEAGLEYEVSNEYERLGGRVLELPKQDWQRIAVAASRN